MLKLIDVRCGSCDRVEEDVFVDGAGAVERCPLCGGERNRVWLRPPAVHNYMGFSNARERDLNLEKQAEHIRTDDPRAVHIDKQMLPNYGW